MYCSEFLFGVYLQPANLCRVERGIIYYSLFFFLFVYFGVIERLRNTVNNMRQKDSCVVLFICPVRVVLILGANLKHVSFRPRQLIPAPVEGLLNISRRWFGVAALEARSL